MVRSPLTRRALCGALVAAVVLHAVSCGMIIHPERVGQPDRGRLDTSIVVLDALGLLLFFVPGVIAFVVDFATGAIYLPAHECANASPDEIEGDYVVVRLDPKTLTRETVERVIREKTGKDTRLDPGAYEAVAIRSLDEFTRRSEMLARDGSRAKTEVLFRAQSER